MYQLKVKFKVTQKFPQNSSHIIVLENLEADKLSSHFSLTLRIFSNIPNSSEQMKKDW